MLSFLSLRVHLCTDAETRTSASAHVKPEERGRQEGRERKEEGRGKREEGREKGEEDE